MSSNGAHEMFGCFFDRENDVQVRAERQFEHGSWEELCSVFSQRDVRPNKFGSEELNGGVEALAPMFNLARFEPREGAPPKRRDWFVTAHSGIIFDLDESVDMSFIQRALSDVEFFAYTTHSHDPEHGATKWRVVFPLLRPVPAAAYKAARAWVVTSFPKAGLIVDAKASALSTAYFLPSCPETTVRFAEAFHNPGLLIELPPIAELKKPASAAAPRKITRTLDWPWIKAKMQQHLALAPAFKAVLKGKAFAEAPRNGAPGSRNDTLSRMCGVLAGWYPYANPDEMAEVFRASLDTMTAERPDDPPPDVEWAAENIERSQSSLLAKAASEQVEFTFAQGMPAEKKTPLAIEPLESFSTPQQEAALERIAREQGFADPDAFRRALFLSSGPSWWVWEQALETWSGPWQEREAYRVAHELLPALAGVQLYRLTANGGLTKKNQEELALEYGKVLNEVIYDLGLQRSQYNPQRKILRLAVPRASELEPEEAPRVIQDWLAALAGDQADKLLDWLATLLRFEMPTAALFIQGGKGSGKSLFARAVARLWDVEGPTIIQHAAAHFNDEILRCPIVWIDEGKWDNFVDPTLVIRRLITEPSRRVDAKYLDKVDLLGHVRVIATVNNFNILAQKESLTPEDRDAIAQRFLQMTPTADAEKIIKSVGSRVEQNKIVEERILARHILWLISTRGESVNVGARYLVEGDTSGAFADRMITDDKGWGSWVTEWLAGWLTDPIRVEGANSHMVYRRDGICMVNPKLLTSTWSTYVKNNVAPRAQEISDALRSLSVSGQITQFPEPNQYGMCGFEIKTDVIMEWVARGGHGSVSSISKNSQGRPAQPHEPRTVIPIREGQSAV